MNHLKKFLSTIDWIDFSLLIISIIALSILVKIIEYAFKQLSKKYPHRRMTVLSWIPLINFSIYFFGFFAAFYLITQPSKEMLLGLLVSGLIALGFAIKDTLTSMVAGVILLIDKPFQVGDRVTFQGFYGDIVSIGLRSVKLLTLDENMVTIPNHRFLNDLVSSSNAGELGMMALVDIHVPPNADLAEIKEMLYQTTRNNAFVNQNGKILIVIQETLNISGVVSIIMRVKCIIKDARTEKAFQTDFMLDINKKFNEQQIKQVTGGVIKLFYTSSPCPCQFSPTHPFEQALATFCQQSPVAHEDFQ